MKTDILIVGAGISGLSCASKLVGRDYLILEKADEVGGYCKTTVQNGFVWDYAGHFFHFNNQEIINDFKDLLSGSDIVLNNKNTKIYYNGYYVDYPFQFNIHQLPKEEFVECLVGLFNRPDHDYSTFKEMLYAKYGKGITEKFLIPYNTKLYACDLNELDKDAMGRFFPQANPEEIINGFVEKQKSTYNDTFYYSKNGAVAFVNKILERVDYSRIFTGTSVESIDRKKKCVLTNKGKFYYNSLIVTLPFDDFTKLADVTTHSFYSSNKVLVFNLGFDADCVRKDLHWVYYPDEDIRFYRVGFYNNILHTDKMSLYVEVGLQKDEIVDIDAEFKQVMKDLEKVGVITNQNLIEKQTIMMNPAYVHVSYETSKERDELISQLANDDIFFVGRYGTWTYCSIEDCIVQAYKTVEKIK